MLSARAAALVGWALTLSGCALDFAQFRVPLGLDASVAPDAAPDATVDLPPPSDVTPVDAPEDVIDDVPAPDDAGCTPGRSATGSFRFAHMAPGLGAVDLCMRRRSDSAAFVRVSAGQWPAAGFEYAQVSASLPFNAPLTRANEAWEFAVLPAGAPCSEAATRALTLRSAQLDPRVMRLLVLTTESSPDGTATGVLNVLNDQACTDCQERQVDVRAVQTSPGSASQRLSFALELVGDPRLPQDLASMRVFAASVSYGSGSDYACNGLWGAFTSALTVATLVQVSASTSAGVVIARSEPTRLKVPLIQQTRTVTVFFEGNDEPSPPGFVICYDGVYMGGYATCDRVRAHLVQPADAGADAGADDASDANDVTDGLAAGEGIS